ncbi:MAG: hypothetical protein GQ545_09190 [Candidatus Aminicenantes bacterium]|nr:hypothetical protein [Candidatus Aminicenantes bacterium]
MYKKIQTIDKSELIHTLSIWNRYLKRKIHMIACGGTALTLLNLKESTIDVDLMIPEPDEYKYLEKTLIDLGYEQKTGTGWQKDRGFRFDLFAGNTIFTTELLESPLDKGNHILFKEFSSIYLGILNYYDLIISKLFRFTPVDREDCFAIIREKSDEIDLERLKSRFYDTSSYDIFDEKNKKNFEFFLDLLKDKNIIK